MHSLPRVCAIILNWNKYTETRECILSLKEADYPNLQIILVNNGSVDNSIERLRKEFPDVTLLINQTNIGFAKGVNVGIKKALTDPTCKYILLFNNDAVMRQGFLKEAIATAESDSSIGILGGKMYQAKDSNKLSYAGGYVSRWKGGIVARGLGQEDRGLYDTPCETGFVIGALMLIRRELIESIGPLPEDYFFGTEDMDYCLTAQEAGYKLYYIPTLAAYHLGGGSHWGWEPKWIYNSYRNKLTLLERHLPRGLFPFYKVAFWFYARFVVRRRWHRLAKTYGYYADRKFAFSNMQRAMLQAIRDHGKGVLSEGVLKKFEREFPLIPTESYAAGSK